MISYVYCEVRWAYLGGGLADLPCHLNLAGTRARHEAAVGTQHLDRVDAW